MILQIYDPSPSNGIKSPPVTSLSLNMVVACYLFSNSLKMLKFLGVKVSTQMHIHARMFTHKSSLTEKNICKESIFKVLSAFKKRQTDCGYKKCKHSICTVHFSGME